MAAREPATMIIAAATRPPATTLSFRGAIDHRSPATPTLANAPLVSSSLTIARAMTNHRAGTNQMTSRAAAGRDPLVRRPTHVRGSGNRDGRLSSKDPICILSVAPPPRPDTARANPRCSAAQAGQTLRAIVAARGTAAGRDRPAPDGPAGHGCERQGHEQPHRAGERARCRQPFEHVQRSRASRKHLPIGKNKPEQMRRALHRRPARAVDRPRHPTPFAGL